MRAKDRKDEDQAIWFEEPIRWLRPSGLVYAPIEGTPENPTVLTDTSPEICVGVGCFASEERGASAQSQPIDLHVTLLPTQTSVSIDPDAPTPGATLGFEVWPEAGQVVEVTCAGHTLLYPVVADGSKFHAHEFELPTAGTARDAGIQAMIHALYAVLAKDANLAIVAQVALTTGPTIEIRAREAGAFHAPSARLVESDLETEAPGVLSVSVLQPASKATGLEDLNVTSVDLADPDPDDLRVEAGELMFLDHEVLSQFFLARE